MRFLISEESDGTLTIAADYDAIDVTYIEGEEAGVYEAIEITLKPELANILEQRYEAKVEGHV